MNAPPNPSRDPAKALRREDGTIHPGKAAGGCVGCGCLGVIALFVLGALITALGGGTPSDDPTPAGPPTVTVTPTETVTAPATSTTTNEPPATSTPPPATSEPAVSTSTRTTAASRPAITRTATRTATPQRLVPEKTATPKPKPRPTRSVEDKPAGGGSVYYENCDAVRAAGAAPIRRGDPGYRPGLDRDGDGQGCGSD